MTEQIFILASGSPRRQELVKLFGKQWEVRVADVDESSVTDPDPAIDVIRTAELKAHEVAAGAPENAVIVAADTTVVLDGHKFDKPKDEDDARQMLQRLRGNVHQVYTGIVIVNLADSRQTNDVAKVDVTMANYSDSDIDSYIATKDPLDKAGAYAIQNPQFQPVANVVGCYSSVIGLPLCHLTRAFRMLQIQIGSNIADACQQHHNYSCPIFSEILGGEKN